MYGIILITRNIYNKPRLQPKLTDTMIMTKRNEYMPQTVSHSGLTLREKLVELGMSQKAFSVRTVKPEQTIVKVINGESSLTPDMAVQFESVLGILANFCLNRQQN
jgi:HTH-type transcriptional regulator/antitoxin HigA